MLYAILVILVIYLSIGWFFSLKVDKPKVSDYEFTKRKAIEIDGIDPEEYDALEKEEFYLTSSYGYPLHCLYFPELKSKKTIVFSHCITWSLWGSVKYISFFKRLGFNILLYDHRYHGKSGGKSVTYGEYEKHDLKTVVDWVYERTGKDSIVGVHGESYGSAVAIEHAGIDKRLAFLISDCGFSELIELFKCHLWPDFHIPSLMVIPISRLFIRFRTGVDIKMINPIETIKNVSVPVFFIHGQKDQYIPAEMTKMMYKEKKSGKKGILLVEQAEHANSYQTATEEYQRALFEFFAELGIVEKENKRETV